MLAHDVRACAGPLQRNGYSCGVYTLWSAFVCAMLHALGLPWSAAYEYQHLAQPKLRLLREFFVQMIYRPLPMSDLAERCRRRAVSRQAGGRAGAAPGPNDDGGDPSAGGPPPGGPPDGSDDDSSDKAPGGGEPPTCRMRSRACSSSSNRAGGSHGRGCSPTVVSSLQCSPDRVLRPRGGLRQDVLPGTSVSNILPTSRRKQPARAQPHAPTPEGQTLHRWFAPLSSSASCVAEAADHDAGMLAGRADAGPAAEWEPGSCVDTVRLESILQGKPDDDQCQAAFTWIEGELAHLSLGMAKRSLCPAGLLAHLRRIREWRAGHASSGFADAASIAHRTIVSVIDAAADELSLSRLPASATAAAAAPTLPCLAGEPLTSVEYDWI